MPLSGSPLRHFLAPVLLPIFLAVGDATILATALPAVASAFGDVARISWVLASYLLASTMAAPIYGRLGDAWGRRRLLIVALALFIVASLLCAAAQSLTELIAARALQGLGGGGLMVMSQALVGENVERDQFGRAQGALATVIMAASSFGPVAGGVLTQLLGWRSVFLVNLPLGLVAIVLARRLPDRGGSGRHEPFDGPGLVLFAGMVVPLLLALELLPHLTVALLPKLAGGLGLSSLSLALLLRQERRAASPLFPLHVLRLPAMWRANAMAACSGALLVSEVTLLPLKLRMVDGISTGRIGLMMLPLTATVGLGSLITGRLISRTRLVAIFPSIGQSTAAAGLLLVAFGEQHADVALGPWALPALLAGVAIFQGSAMPVAQITMQATAPLDLLGATSASVQLSRSIGSAAGVTLSLGTFVAAMSARGAAAILERTALGAPAHLTILSGPMRMGAADIAASFTTAFAVVAVFAAVNALLAWTLPLRRL